MTSRLWTGVLAGVGSALIGGGWQLATRHSTSAQGVAPIDLALLRYLIPALVLLPLLWRARSRMRAVPSRLLAVLVAGGGLPFGLLAMGGAALAPAAHMGVLVAGASPLFAALLAWGLWRERPQASREAGLLLVALGVALLGLKAWAGGASWRGDLLFLAAALVWACFTLAFRQSGLSPWEGTAFINAASAAMLLPWLLWHGAPTLSLVPWATLFTVALWQGVLAGLLGLALFAVAIDRLGAAPAAAFGALAPVVSAIGGTVWLGEALGPTEWLAVAATAAGVGLASGAVRIPAWR